MAAGWPPDGTVMTAVPVPWTRAPALVTEPCVRTTLTGRTSSLEGAGTRACQLGFAGHVGNAATDGFAGSRTVIAATNTMVTSAPIKAWRGCCLENSPW